MAKKQKFRALIQGVSLWGKRSVYKTEELNIFAYRKYKYDINDFKEDRVNLDTTLVKPIGKYIVKKHGNTNYVEKKLNKKQRKYRGAYVFSNKEECLDIQ